MSPPIYLFSAWLKIRGFQPSTNYGDDRGKQSCLIHQGWVCCQARCTRISENFFWSFREMC